MFQCCCPKFKQYCLSARCICGIALVCFLWAIKYPKVYNRTLFTKYSQTPNSHCDRCLCRCMWFLTVSQRSALAMSECENPGLLIPGVRTQFDPMFTLTEPEQQEPPAVDCTQTRCIFTLGACYIEERRLVNSWVNATQHHSDQQLMSVEWKCRIRRWRVHICPIRAAFGGFSVTVNCVKSNLATPVHSEIWNLRYAFETRRQNPRVDSPFPGSHSSKSSSSLGHSADATKRSSAFWKNTHKRHRKESRHVLLKWRMQT